jgi:hypothetical protein
MQLKKIVLKENIKINNTLLRKGAEILAEFRYDLMEMPHIAISKDKIVDLEFENIKSFDEFMVFVNNILDGKKFRDKYGNILYLKNDQDKHIFVNDLLNNKIFNTIILSKFKKDEIDKIYALLDEYV